MKEFNPIEEVLPVKLVQDAKQDIKEQKKSPITVLLEEDEKYLSDEARVPTTNEARVCTKQ